MNLPIESGANIHRVYLMPLKQDRYEDTEGRLVWKIQFHDAGVSWKDARGRLAFFPWHRIDQIDGVLVGDITEDDDDVIGLDV